MLFKAIGPVQPQLERIENCAISILIQLKKLELEDCFYSRGTRFQGILAGILMVP